MLFLKYYYSILVLLLFSFLSFLCLHLSVALQYVKCYINKAVLSYSTTKFTEAEHELNELNTQKIFRP